MNTATLTDTAAQWVLELEPDVAMRAKRIFHALDSRGVGKLLLSATPEHCRDLLWFAERYPVDITPRAIAERWAKQHVDHLRALGDLLTTHTPAAITSMALPPRPYQEQAARIAVHTGGLLLGDVVGLGKTCTSYTCAAIEPGILPLVIVAPAHLASQWVDEAAKFVPHLFAWITPTTQPDALPQRNGSGPDIIVTTYHRLHGWAQVLAAYAHGIVFDEVQELRHPDTVKYTAARHIARAVRFRLGLSATPIHNYGDEMHTLYQILSPDQLGTREEFIREWCTYGHKATLRNPTAFGLHLRKQGLFLRRTRHEVARELPPVTVITHEVASDRQQFDACADQVRALAETILDATADPKMRFTAGGQLDSALRQATGIAKAPAVAAFVRMLHESGEGPVLLGGWHRVVYDVWCQAFDEAGIRWAMYTGSESTAPKRAAKAAWMRGDLDVLILSLRSGAGLDGLQERGCVVVFGELDWAPAVHEQFIGRLARDGQADAVMAYHLISDDGSDPIMVDVLGLKREQLDRVRNVDADIQETIPDSTAHIRRLAESWIQRKASA